MAWIPYIESEQASGILTELYDEYSFTVDADPERDDCGRGLGRKRMLLLNSSSRGGTP